jgi:hypothetical protein
MTRTINRRRLLALTILAISLCAAPVAAAQDADHDRGGGAVVAPAKDKWLGESWAQLYSLPLSEHPFVGNGNNCLTLANKVIQAIGSRPCTIEQGSAFTFSFGTAWSSAEDPFPQTKAEQGALALAADQGIVSVTATVDDGPPIDIRTPRFELFSPQRTVLLPADNFLGVPGPGTVTLTAHGWGAVVRKLGLGQHTIVGDAVFADGELIVPHHITVVPRTHADQDPTPDDDNLQDHAHA